MVSLTFKYHIMTPPLFFRGIFVYRVFFGTIFLPELSVAYKVTADIKKCTRLFSCSFIKKGFSLFSTFFSFLVCDAKSLIEKEPELSTIVNLNYCHAKETHSPIDEIPWYVTGVNWIIAHPLLTTFIFLLIVSYFLLPLMRLIYVVLEWFSKPLQLLFQKLPVPYQRAFRKYLKRIRNVIDEIINNIKKTDGIL